jgi:hypothetical protein
MDSVATVQLQPAGIGERAQFEKARKGYLIGILLLRWRLAGGDLFATLPGLRDALVDAFILLLQFVGG